MNAVIRTEKLTRRLEGEVPVTLVADIDMEVRAGELTVISGPSGSGKSSLLYLLGLLDVPTSGKIWLRGREVSGLSDDELADERLEHLGFVFQFHFLLPEFTAIENVMLPLRRLGRLGPTAMIKRASEALASLGLGDHLHKLPKQLSGGQSQRVAIARALVNDPILILADEPTGNLDSAASANVQNILKDLARGQGRAIAAVTHDPGFAAEADRVIPLKDGRLDQAQPRA